MLLASSDGKSGAQIIVEVDASPIIVVECHTFARCFILCLHDDDPSSTF